jgi:hypothetical protein
MDATLSLMKSVRAAADIEPIMRPASRLSLSIWLNANSRRENGLRIAQAATLPVIIQIPDHRKHAVVVPA